MWLIRTIKLYGCHDSYVWGIRTKKSGYISQNVFCPSVFWQVTREESIVGQGRKGISMCRSTKGSCIFEEMQVIHSYRSLSFKMVYQGCTYLSKHIEWYLTTVHFKYVNISFKKLVANLKKTSLESQKEAIALLALHNMLRSMHFTKYTLGTYKKFSSKDVTRPKMCSRKSFWWG